MSTLHYYYLLFSALCMLHCSRQVAGATKPTESESITPPFSNFDGDLNALRRLKGSTSTIQICHFPKTNPTNYVTYTIGVKDLGTYKSTGFVVVGTTCEDLCDPVDETSEILQAIDDSAGAISGPRVVTVCPNDYWVDQNSTFTLSNPVEIRCLVAGSCFVVASNDTNLGFITLDGGSSLTVTGFVFENFVVASDAHGDVQGILAATDSGLSIIECTFADNNSTYGAPVVAASSVVMIVRSVFLHNYGENYYGAVTGFDSSITISSSFFGGFNEFPYGAVYAANGSSLTIKGDRASGGKSMFDRNYSNGPWGGGAVSVTSDSSVTIENTQFENNAAYYWGQNGGAIYLEDPALNAVRTIKGGCSFINNYADGDGGAIYGTVTIAKRAKPKFSMNVANNGQCDNIANYDGSCLL